MHRAFTYRLSPTVKQTQALARLMALQCELYNAALEERRMTYEWNRRGISSVKAPTKCWRPRCLHMSRQRFVARDRQAFTMTAVLSPEG